LPRTPARRRPTRRQRTRSARASCRISASTEPSPGPPTRNPPPARRAGLRQRLAGNRHAKRQRLLDVLRRPKRRNRSLAQRPSLPRSPRAKLLQDRRSRFPCQSCRMTRPVARPRYRRRLRTLSSRNRQPQPSRRTARFRSYLGWPRPLRSAPGRPSCSTVAGTAGKFLPEARRSTPSGRPSQCLQHRRRNLCRQHPCDRLPQSRVSFRPDCDRGSISDLSRSAASSRITRSPSSSSLS